MKTARIKLNRSISLAPKPKLSGKAPANPAARGSQPAPGPSGPPDRTAGPLPTSHWSIHEPHPALSHATSTNPTTAKPADQSVRLQVVRFELFAAGAHAVFLAGSFNDWNPTATPMTPCGEAKWMKELSLSPAQYQYRFVVDGQWIEDPMANDSVLNPFGGCNSVVHVE